MEIGDGQHNLNLAAAYLFSANRIEFICEWCIHNDIKFLTIEFSTTQYWEKRSKHDLGAVMDSLCTYINSRCEWYINHNIKVVFRGRRSYFDNKINDSITKIEEATANCNKLILTMDADYNGRTEIVRAIAEGARTEEELSRAIMGDLPEPELILRTGGYQRLSGFMMWESIYSELYFIDKLFPDLTIEDLNQALIWFNHQQRNFGK